MKVTIEKGEILTIKAENTIESCALRYLFEGDPTDWHENIIIDYSFGTKRRNDDEADD
jgi:hypothetical protein